MSDDKPSPNRRFLFGGIAALIGLSGILFTGIYAVEALSGNGGSAAACSASVSAQSAIDPHIGGEVAALILQKGPRDVSQTAFFTRDDEPLTVADFNGRTILLNLWATWCAPCRKEMPELDRLEAELGGETFRVVTVNIDRRNPEKVSRFWSDTGIQHLEFYQDTSGAIFNKLRSQSLAFGMPTTLLVGPDGCLVGHLAGQAKWDSDDAIRLIEAALQSTGT